jgi:DNA recombination protein RmuC
MDLALWLTLALVVVNLFLVLWFGLRPRRDGDDEQRRATALVDSVRSGSERLERELRDEVGRSAQATRLELGNALGVFQQTLLNQQGDVARTQNEQIDSFRTQLAAMQTTVSQTLQAAVGAQTAQAHASREAQDMALKRFSDAMSEQLRALSEANERRLNEVRATVEQRLATLQQGNELKLEQMRATVDEKLHATLEARLGESFKQVAERLEQVHRGLGEMQTLARDVGSLSRVLNNVKTRGTLGEVQLAGLLEHVLTPEQYERNVETIPGSNARVDFAIRLPGRREDGAPMWLPIDCKFPRDDYERLLEAHERADRDGVEAAAKAIEARLRVEAKSIREKYIASPYTTDFGILFVPTEGLYAEALRRPGLVEALQRDHRITLAGPTTLMATLTSLQMGFRTLALEKRSVEVWEVLGAVKTEFAKFGDVLAKTKKKLDEASRTIDAAEVRTRAMARSLRGVEAMPDARAQALLPGLPVDAVDAGDAGDDEEAA